VKEQMFWPCSHHGSREENLHPYFVTPLSLQKEELGRYCHAGGPQFRYGFHVCHLFFRIQVAVDSYYNESSVTGIEAYFYTTSHSGYNLMVPLTKIINFNVQVFLDKLKSVTIYNGPTNALACIKTLIYMLHTKTLSTCLSTQYDIQNE
jgi:hypothetical protein